jgi:biopolymer transport protein ExbB
MIETVLEWFDKGGPVMYPLLLCSILVVAIVLEKLFALRRTNVMPPELIRLLKPSLLARDYDGLIQECRQAGSPLGRVVAALVLERRQGREDLKDILVEKGREELPGLRRHQAILGTIAGVSPLLGLLGTVLGMIRVFGVISAEGLGSTAGLSQGISEALLTTATGLSIAIPALVAHQIIQSRIEALAHALEQHGLQVIRLLTTRFAPGAENPAVATGDTSRGSPV